MTSIPTEYKSAKKANLQSTNQAYKKSYKKPSTSTFASPPQ